MYNSEVKEQFIADFSTNAGRRHAATVMFNTLERYEKSWGADLCTRSAEELQPVVDEISGLRTNSRKLRLAILREYVKWCIDHQIPGACDGLLQIEEVGIDKLKRQMVANPQHLQRYLNCIFDKESDNTVECVYRCFYWLAYAGMRECDALELKKDDVDIAHMVVNYEGKEYPIYREAIAAFQNCINLEQFRYMHPNYRDGIEIYKDRYPGDKLLRGFSERKSNTSLRVEVSRRGKNPRYKPNDDDESLNLKLSYYRVWLSGLFYRMYEAERAGMPVDFMAAAADFMEGKTYKLDRSRNLIGAKQRQIANEYLADYLRWKEAFSI